MNGRGQPVSINTNTWNRIRYTLWAPIYDRIAAFPTYRRRSVDMLGLAPGEEVLIVGAGTGADLPHLPTTVNLTAIDLTPAMLNRLRARAQALGRPVDARVMDGQALDLPTARFDAVILHLILAVIPDPVACIKEVERVLKPGGRVVIFDKFVPDAEEPGMGRRRRTWLRTCSSRILPGNWARLSLTRPWQLSGRSPAASPGCPTARSF
jgi:phosphatidylethanolamine/phosphatidyl-N-methylethanolamine N-methyltransferase